jgi:CsoR family transcriptional regulator, copper-sensing transcriptional repressor
MSTSFFFGGPNRPCVTYYWLTNRVREIISILYTLGGYGVEEEHKKRDITLRLKRIEGQVRGLQKMVENGTPCAEVLTQVAAVTAAIKKVGMVVVQTYMEECFEKIEKEPGMRKAEAMRDLQRAISQYIDWA